MNNLYETIVNFINEQLCVDAEKITPETRLVADLKADDLDIVEIVTTIEEAFDIEITDEELTDIMGMDGREPVDTVETLVKLMERRL